MLSGGNVIFDMHLFEDIAKYLTILRNVVFSR